MRTETKVEFHRAEDAVERGAGICRTCLAPIWFEHGQVGGRTRPEPDWSDRIERGGDSLVCFKAVGYRHVPLDGREACIYDRAYQRGATVYDGGESAAEMVDQTILASDPKRPGNCVSACVATFLEIPLEQVPHFIEQDAAATTDGSEGSDRWWFMLIGFMAGYNLWPVELDDLAEGHPGEVLFVAGMSPRGVLHQVLYRDGVLWHDPHPSKEGVNDVREVLAWRPMLHDHTPTPDGA